MISFDITTEISKNYAKFDSFYLNKSIRFFFQAYSLYDSNYSSSAEYKPGRNLNNQKIF